MSRNKVQAAFAAVDARTAEYRAFLRDIITMESYTTDKPALDALADFIHGFCLDHGFHVQLFPFEQAGNCLRITMNEDAVLPPVALTGHIDTVFPKGSFAPPVYREADGKCFGPGVVDMKGGVAVALLAMQALLDADYRDRPIRLFLVSDEERSEGLTGERGKALIRETAAGCAAAITTEGRVDGTITVGRKGSIRYQVRVKGIASHAGMAYADGRSAIKEAARKILAIEAASDPERITYNCGLISGGTSPNTVPEDCEFTLYNRFWTMKQREELRSHVSGILETTYIADTQTACEQIGERPPMEPSEQNHALYRHIDATSVKYGFPHVEPGRQASGSDAAYTALAGAPSVCSMGMIGGFAHNLKEYAELDSLTSQAKIIAASIMELPEEFPPAER